MSVLRIVLISLDELLDGCNSGYTLSAQKGEVYIHQYSTDHQHRELRNKMKKQSDLSCDGTNHDKFNEELWSNYYHREIDLYYFLSEKLGCIPDLKCVPGDLTFEATYNISTAKLLKSVRKYLKPK